MAETTVTSTEPAGGDGRASRAARTRIAVVDALLALNEKGNLRPTAREIAAEAGVSLRSIYVHFDDVESLAFTPNGLWMVSGGDDRAVRVWDMQAVREAKVLDGHESKVLSVAVSPDGKRFASASKDTTILLWDLEVVLIPK